MIRRGGLFMSANKKFGVIGGDVRQIYAAEQLIKMGYQVKIAGFDNQNEPKSNTQNLGVFEVIDSSNYIIFPVPVSRDTLNINAPFSVSPIPINGYLLSKLENKVVFGGIISPLLQGVNNPKFILKDYYAREDFMVLNAVPTAEGAIKIILSETNKTIFGSKCLVIGYGRIGKVIARLLKNLGASVTVSLRNSRDFSWAKLENFEIINVSENDKNLNFDFVLNTVPAMVLNYENLKFLNRDALIVDVASAPGGVNKPDAEKLGIRVISALGLPGKHFPKSAGEIITETVLKILKEENL